MVNMFFQFCFKFGYFKGAGACGLAAILEGLLPELKGKR
jgi:hypothetical protein